MDAKKAESPELNDTPKKKGPPIKNEEIWEATFQRVFQILEERYTIQEHANYKCKYTVNTEGKFECISCGHSWSSVSCNVSFDYYISEGIYHCYENLVIRLRGRQRCKRCKRDFLQPVIEKDQIYFALELLVYCLIKKYYVHDEKKIAHLIAELIGAYRRIGQGRHMSELCQGCKNGTCRRGNKKPTFVGRKVDGIEKSVSELQHIPNADGNSKLGSEWSDPLKLQRECERRSGVAEN